MPSSVQINPFIYPPDISLGYFAMHQRKLLNPFQKIRGAAASITKDNVSDAAVLRIPLCRSSCAN